MSRRSIFVILLMVGSLGCGRSRPAIPKQIAPPEPQSAAEFIGSARAAQSEDRMGQALQLLETAIQRFPENADPKIERAKLLATLGRTAESVAILKQIAGNDPRVLNLLGYSLLIDGQLVDGAATLERAIGIAEQAGHPYAPAYYHLGLYRLTQGDWRGARPLFRKATEANPEHLEAHYQWLNCAEHLGDQADAATARAGFERLNAQQLRRSDSFKEPDPKLLSRIDRGEDVEWRSRVDQTSFRRKLPAGSTLEVACRVDPLAPAWFSIKVVSGPGAGSTLLEVVHAVTTPTRSWIPHAIELPSGAAGAELELEFSLGSPSRWRRWLGRDVPIGAAFSEPRAVPPAAARSRDPRPNVLLISLDTLRADRLAAYGAKRHTAPTLSLLATRGVLYARAEAASNWTLPSHYSILSGLTPSAHGVLPETDQTRGYLFPDRKLNLRGSGQEVMLAEKFAEAGYRTAAHTEDGWVSGRFGFDQGFGLYRSDLRGSATGTTAAVLDDLDRFGAQGPWFMFVHSYAAHQPYHAPKEFRTRFSAADFVGLSWPAALVPIKDYYRFRLPIFPPTPSDVRSFRDLYDGQVDYADSLVAAIVDWLERHGLAEQTVIAVTSDHGEELFERGRFDHGETLFEEVTHVPMIVVAPGKLPAGRVVPHPVSTIDLSATLLDLAGLGDELGEGRSLRGEPTPRICFADALAHGGEQLGAAWDGPLKYLRSVTGKTVKESLYDLANDPEERTDISARRPAELERLRRAYLDHLEQGAAIKAKLGTGTQELDRETIERLNSLGYAHP